jgi:choice-of-anchor A domain-containing protein/MYXO-CTERM domain-containing protein
MAHGNPRHGRVRATLSIAGTGLLGTLSVAVASFAVGPVTGAGATTPATLNCGTLEISGTDSHSHQFSEFTTGDAARSNADANGSVAYGGNFTASNWSVGNGITTSASQLTTLVGGNETGQLNVNNGSAVMAGSAGGPVNLNQSGATKAIGGGASSLPFSFSSIGSALTACSNNYGPGTGSTTGTVNGVGFSSPFTAVLGFWGTGNVNVFTVTADQLAQAQRLDFSVPAGSTNLIEVQPSADHPTSLNLSGISSGIFYGCPNSTPTAATWSSGNCGSQPGENDNTSTIGQERDDTVWNFAPMSFASGYALTIGAWQGTVVAPTAALTLANKGNFDGSLFVASLSGSEQSGFDPFGSGEPIPATVDPLPSLSQGLPIAMGGFALVGFAGLLVWRRRHVGQSTVPSDS